MLGMSRQEMFNKVCNHLVTQKERSALRNNGCRYRGPNGLKCAIGALIPDDMYDPKMDDVIHITDVKYLFTNFKNLEINEEDVGFLDYLQSIHDNKYDWNADGFQGFFKLRKIAEEHNLEIPDCIKDKIE